MHVRCDRCQTATSHPGSRLVVAATTTHVVQTLDLCPACVAAGYWLCWRCQAVHGDHACPTEDNDA
jgi:hypothetical protein